MALSHVVAVEISREIQWFRHYPEWSGGEYFDVLPYAEEAGDYLMGIIKNVKLPRKLKVGFSNSPANVTHATFRDLGFVAKADGTFDVYSAGGLGK